MTNSRRIRSLEFLRERFPEYYNVVIQIQTVIVTLCTLPDWHMALRLMVVGFRSQPTPERVFYAPFTWMSNWNKWSAYSSVRMLLGVNVCDKLFVWFGFLFNNLFMCLFTLEIVFIHIRGLFLTFCRRVYVNNECFSYYIRALYTYFKCATLTSYNWRPAWDQTYRKLFHRTQYYTSSFRARLFSRVA